MKRKLIFLIPFLFFTIVAAAQQVSLQVNVSTAKGEPAAGATLQLYTLTDSVLLTAQVASVKGTALFRVSPFTVYLLKVSAVGYEAIETSISVKDLPIQLPILLVKKSASLSGVEVISRKQLLKQEDDKTIVDATVLANSSSNAYEVLEKTPGAVIDQDGNVYLSSTSPATIFINGREMKLSSADIASLLKSLPAGSVSKIEILRNPSAKYDAASSGGIVNIVLKKGVKLGTSGSVNAAVFQGVYNTATLGFNLNKSTGRVNSYFSYQYTKRNNYEALTSNRLIKTDSSLLAQNSYTTYPSVNNYFGGGLDVALTKKFNLTYDIRLTNTSSNSNASNSNAIYQEPAMDVLNNSRSDVTNKTDALFIGNTITAKYKIDSAGSEWTAELDYNYYKNNNTQAYNNNFILPVSPVVNGSGENKNGKNIYVAQTDLILKLPSTITLETGVKLTASNSNNSADYFYSTGNGPAKPDLYQTNTFRYKETISAAYVQVAKMFFGFTLKPGLRLETTDINGRQLIPKDTVFSIKRTDLFPYVFLRHNLFKMFGRNLVGNAIYRRSIKRPYYEILNPYPKYIDQYLFDVGNPKLQPQFTTNYEVNVTFMDFPVFAVGINQTNDIFSNVTYQDDVTKIAYRTYDNLGKNKETYMRVIAGMPPGGKYFFYMGAQYNYNEYNGIYQNKPLNYKRGSWLFFMYQELKATKTITLNVQGFMRTKAVQNFYELDNFGGLYFSINKSMLNKKGNVILSVNDLLQTNHTNFTLNQGNVHASGSRVNDTRRLGLTFRYNLGLSKPKKEGNTFGAPVDSKDN
ncbi:TonB-dependent receptor [Ferruginibacter paludis]|uniref:outer membrane beta-barrel protein n=1 Tax=Ferruginibacter paludis TaxID=1310417 RepID=UPI0025B43383|nr:outer membrane beta-barrel protein [Ferruginibacter paludis]MDN3659137.1 TonB-dependent receptor [Ferruginibacter paludis]